MLACTVGLAASAQNQDPRRRGDRAEMAQRLESQKIAFYTEAIDLTPEEAKDFWPVYNAVEADQAELTRAERNAFKALNVALKEGKSDKEIDALLDVYIKASEANVNLHFKAAASYRSVLDPVKVARFFAAQERFRRQQFYNLRANSPRENHNGPGSPAGPGHGNGHLHGSQN